MEASKDMEKQGKVVSSSRRALLAISGEDDEWHNFYDVSTKQCNSKLIPELANKNIWICSYGWLVLHDNDSDNEWFLFHFESNEKVKLPSLPLDIDIDTIDNDCFLFLPPNHPDCRLLLFDSRGTYLICKPGAGEDDTFVRHQTTRPELEQPMFVECQGQAYSFFDTGPLARLTRIDFVNSEIVFGDFIEIPFQHIRSSLETYRYRCYLVASNNGDILLIRTLYFGYDGEVEGFKVFRINFEKGEWSRMRSIGDMAIFVSYEHSTGTCCVAAEYGVEPNSIYVMLKREDRCLYKFSLDDESITMTLPCPTISRFDARFEWLIL